MTGVFTPLRRMSRHSCRPSVSVRQADVEQYQLELVLRERLQRLLPVCRLTHADAFVQLHLLGQ